MLLLAVSEAVMLNSSFSCLAINTGIHPNTQWSIRSILAMTKLQIELLHLVTTKHIIPIEAFLMHQLAAVVPKVRGILVLTTWADIQPALLD